MSNALNVGATNPTAKGIGSVDYFDLALRLDVGGGSVMRFGVVNLFDRAPPIWTGQGVTDPATYDLIQRRFHIGVTARF